MPICTWLPRSTDTDTDLTPNRSGRLTGPCWTAGVLSKLPGVQGPC